jgi:hypothetical protein
MSEGSRQKVRYQRPRSPIKLTINDKRKLIDDYLEHYCNISKRDPKLLKSLLPTEVFGDLLAKIGTLLIDESRKLLESSDRVHDFLDNNSLPPSLAELIPSDFRVFCLALNALKVWVSAEQAATDKFLLGGTVREQLRTVTDTCLVTGKKFAEVGCELHHPVRDGRPPLPLSPEAHKAIERQIGRDESDPNLDIIYKIRAKNRRSLKDLRRECLELLGQDVTHGSPNVKEASKTFARNVSKETGLSCADLLALLDTHGIGLE